MNYSLLTGLPAIVIFVLSLAAFVLILILFAVLRHLKSKKPKTEEITRERELDLQENAEFVSISVVAIKAYEKHRTDDTYELSSAYFSDSFANASNNESEVLNAIAMVIALSGIDLFGKHAPSNLLERISLNIENNYQFKDNGNALRLIGNDTPQYIDLSIKQTDVDNAINEINEYQEES